MCTLTLLVLYSPDPARLRAFYEALGLRCVAEQHERGLAHFAATLSNCVLEIYPAGDGAVSRVRLGLQIADPQSAMDEVERLGGTVRQSLRPSPWGLRAVVVDPDGNTVELHAS